MRYANTLLVVGFIISTTNPKVNAAPDGNAQMPAIAQEATIAASLDAVQKNLRKGRFRFQRDARARNATAVAPSTLTSCHSVRCDTPEVAKAVQKWARTNGFTPSDLITKLSHGSAEIYFVELGKNCAFNASTIHGQCEDIFAAMKEIEGATYVDWCPVLED